MSNHTVFFQNNMYYYCNAKRILQEQKKKVRFKLDYPDGLFGILTRTKNERPLNCSDFVEIDSYIAPPLRSNCTHDYHYPVEYLPRSMH